MAPPDPLLVDRFRRDLAALGGEGERLGLAVSGGPDSLALLLLAAAALPGMVEAATVDHGLRAEAAAEAEMVADLCRALDVPHATLRVDVPARGAGLQGEARRARYAALAEWANAQGLPLLATAHHADDQAETILMRLQRGAGLSGLAAIRPVRAEGPDLTVVRPLLGWTRAELASLVAEAGIHAADDPSNRDPRFDRVRMRAFLAANPAFEQARLARSAAACREADDALAWVVGQLADDRINEQGGEWRIDADGLPRAIARRLLLVAMAQIRAAHDLPVPAGRDDVESLLAALEAGGAGTLGGVMGRGGRFWHLRAAPPRRPVSAPAGG
jgi:tRNA(Ile)-lysidine synthase